MATLMVTSRFTVEAPDEDTQELQNLFAQMVADQDDELHVFARHVETLTGTDRRDLVALWMVEKYHLAGDFADKVREWDWDVQKGTK